MRFPATTIDLGSLPKPQIIEALDYETILAASKADAIARGAAAGITIDTLDLETELITIVLQSCAFRELLCRKRVNDGALALLLAFALGPDLEQVGARFGVTRMPAAGVTNARLPVADFPEDWENDDRLRRRIQLAPDAYSNAGTLRGYEYHALSAGPDAEIVDCNVYSSQPGRIDIVLLAAGGQPSDSAFNAVYKRVTAKDVKPLTDDVRVTKANVIPYTVDATLRIPRGPDPGLVKSFALTGARTYGASTFKVGAKVYRSGFYAGLQVPNVFNVVLDSPLADFDPGSNGVGMASFDIKTEIVDG